MANVLVVEDDRAIADLVALYLRRDGHEVEIVGDGAVAWRRFEERHPEIDLVVLDLMLPGLDGRGVCRRMRGVADVPILMLTALDDERDKIEGLDLGADDYVTKPFHPGELMARVRALLRRAARPAPAASDDHHRISLANACIDLDAHRLLANEQEVRLRVKEFDLLVALAEHPDVVLTRDQLLERVWGGEYPGETRTVDVHVSRLRDRLEAAGAQITIETVRSVGYRLSAPR
ncbi:MAG: response regulator transcription factor [Thermomicrobiales bacterium]